MDEELADYLLEAGIKVLSAFGNPHARSVEILRDLRSGMYDVVVGINLLREGLDLPEVSLVAILDADKEGFLRSSSALIQTIGRAARHINGRVLLYADQITPSMQAALNETTRRRQKQMQYNQEHGIVPASIIKEIRDLTDRVRSVADERVEYRTRTEIPKDEALRLIKELEKQMKAERLHWSSRRLQYRDQIIELREIWR